MSCLFLHLSRAFETGSTACRPSRLRAPSRRHWRPQLPSACTRGPATTPAGRGQGCARLRTLDGLSLACSESGAHDCPLPQHSEFSRGPVTPESPSHPCQSSSTGRTGRWRVRDGNLWRPNLCLSCSSVAVCLCSSRCCGLTARRKQVLTSRSAALNEEQMRMDGWCWMMKCWRLDEWGFRRLRRASRRVAAG